MIMEMLVIVKGVDDEDNDDGDGSDITNTGIMLARYTRKT